MPYLHSIGVAVGPAIPLAEAAGADEDAAVVEVLSAEGFRDIPIADSDVCDLARRAMIDTLTRGSIDGADVDAVIVATESFWEEGHGQALTQQRLEHLRLRDSLLQAITDAGLIRAYPYGAWMSACGNLGTALGLARALVVAGQHQRIMVVAAERQLPELPRFMRSGAAALGDGAASCLVQAAPAPGFFVEAAVSVAAPNLVFVDPRKEFSRIVLETHRAIRRLDRDFAAKAGAPIAKADHIVAGHFHVDALKIIADTLQLAPSRLRRDGRASYAHMDAADNLLTLRQIDDADALTAGERIVLLNTGVWSWSAIALRKQG